MTMKIDQSPSGAVRKRKDAVAWLTQGLNLCLYLQNGKDTKSMGAWDPAIITEDAGLVVEEFDVPNSLKPLDVLIKGLSELFEVVVENSSSDQMVRSLVVAIKSHTKEIDKAVDELSV